MEEMERNKRLGRKVKEPTPEAEKPENIVTAKVSEKRLWLLWFSKRPTLGRPGLPQALTGSPGSTLMMSASTHIKSLFQERASLLVKAQELKANTVEENPEEKIRREEAVMLADLTARTPSPPCPAFVAATRFNAISFYGLRSRL